MALVLPAGPFERDAAQFPEQDVLLQHDDEEDGDPVGHEGEEVFENLKEVVAARDGADELDDDDGDDPEPAGHGFEVAAQDLQVDGRCVGARDVVLDGGEGEDDGAEAAEAAEGAVAGEEEGAGRGGVGNLPVRDDGDAAAEADADDVDEGEGGEEAEPGHEEGEGLGGAGRVVDVEVGAGGRPADGDRVLQGEEGEPVGGDFAGGAGYGGAGGEGRVEVGAGGADEDEEGDELGNEGPSDVRESMRLAVTLGKGGERENVGGVRVRCIWLPFEDVKDGHSEYRYHANDEGGNYDAHDDCHVPAVDGRKHLPSDNATDNAVSDHEDGI